MRITDVKGAPVSPETNILRRRRLRSLISDEFYISDHPSPPRRKSTNSVDLSNNGSIDSSPWSQPSPYMNSPWVREDHEELKEHHDNIVFPKRGLIGSLIREDGHIYSIAAAGDFLFTGSESKNIRVWKNLQAYSGFKSRSGLVKAIVVYEGKIFTGHQDGKIRVWSLFVDEMGTFNKVGHLPRTRDVWKKSMNPKNYVEVRRNIVVPWIKHYDTVSCMCVDADNELLYSGSWDKTLKVWRIKDFKCLESVHAHDDTLNALAIGLDGMVFTGSADGTVKAWRREVAAAENGATTAKHVLAETLLRHEHATTALAVSRPSGAVYAGSSDGMVRFWERGKGSAMAYGGGLRGHKLAVLCVAVAGKLVLSGSADKTICVWRRDVGGEHSFVAVLTGHGGPVKCLAVEKDTAASEAEEGGKSWIVYSGSVDKSVKIWRVSENDGA